MSARRPLPLRLLPPRLAGSLFWRRYRSRAADFPDLYQGAPLRFAPSAVMDLQPGDVISDSIAFTGFFELELTRRVARLARGGGRLVDIGANLGYFTLVWCAQRSDNTAIAFEPSPRVSALLKRNVTQNDLARRVEIVEAAAGREAGRARFDTGPVDQTGWGGFAGAGAGGAIEVSVVRAADVVGDRPIALLKIDAEGADAWALEGCSALLERRQVAEVWFEQNKPRQRALGIAEDRAQQVLTALGYRVAARSDPAADIVAWSAVPGQQPAGY